MAAELWDVIVIGGGIIGLNTAYQAAKEGLHTLVLEQFSLPHTRGSSHGQSRIIRKVHRDDAWSKVVREAYDMWKEIERESKEKLLVETGLVLLQQGPPDELRHAQAALKKYDIPHEWLDVEQLNSRYPMARFGSGYNGVLDYSGGILLSDKCMQTVKSLVERYGGVIKDNVVAHDVYPGTAVTTVTTSKGTFQCKKLVLALGPWVGDWMRKLDLDVPFRTMPGLLQYWTASNPRDYAAPPFTQFYDLFVTKDSYYVVSTAPVLEYPSMLKTKPGLHQYWKVLNKDHVVLYGKIPVVEEEFFPTPQCTSRFIALFPISDYPNLIKAKPGLHQYWKVLNKDHMVLYGKVPVMAEEFFPTPQCTWRFIGLFPISDYPNMLKVVTRGEPAPFYCHPDERDLRSMQDMTDVVSDYIKKHFPGVAAKPSIVEPCMYTMTPDKVPVMDYHPHHKNIIIGGGFAGRGFMMAPLAGRILYELVIGKPDHDVHLYRLDRFNQPKVHSRL